jgi:outer membrane protein
LPVFLPLSLGLLSAAHAERRLSLEASVKLAYESSPQLKLEQAKVDEAQATRKSTRGLYGPKLSMDGNLFVWDEELSFEFPLPEQLQAFLDPEDLNLGNIRDQVTAQLKVQLAQPLTPLLQIHNGYEATSRLADAAALDFKAKRVEVAHSVTKSYLELMQALQYERIANTGVEQVKAHVERAQHFHAAGLIGKQDVLKAQVELARAEERVIKARYGVSLARSALALSMGLDVGASIVPTETLRDPPPDLELSVEEAIRRALARRDDLSALGARHEAAEAGARRAGWQMFPQISAVGAYQYTEGQGVFYPTNSFFVGGVLSWDIWDWGNTYYEMQAAREKAHQAEIGRRLLRDGITIQTKKAYLDLKQSREALTVARAAIREAEENYRIERSRFEANANTSTDVLDAQLALTRAELSYTTSLYGYYLARAELYRAMGKSPR